MAKGQRHWCLHLSPLGSVICLFLSGCSGPNHPDRTRYEYLYIDGRFEAPYASFPQGSERVKWKCFDQKLQRELHCTMVRGGWEYFQYIYRERG
jgi:hypothetical protein